MTEPNTAYTHQEQQNLHEYFMCVSTSIQLDTCKWNLYSSFFSNTSASFSSWSVRIVVADCVLALYPCVYHQGCTRTDTRIRSWCRVWVLSTAIAVVYSMYVHDSFVTAVKPAKESSSSHTTSVEKWKKNQSISRMYPWALTASTRTPLLL